MVNRTRSEEPRTAPTPWTEQVVGTSDGQRWKAWVDAIKNRDIFFVHDYVTALEESLGVRAQLYFYGNDRDYIVYPFFLRRIADLPFLKSRNGLDEDVENYDIESPYGYSGPLAHISQPETALALWDGFVRQFHRFCKEHGIVAEFARLNPFVRNHEALAAVSPSVHERGCVVCVDLSQSEAELWGQLNRGNKSKIHRAQRSGVRIASGCSDDDLEVFSTLYLRTMERRDAAAWYHFNRDFAPRLRARLGARVQGFSARVGGETAASALFIYETDVLHYYLGGSEERHFSLRPSNLLMFEAILWAKAMGFRYLNLGGGQKAGDGLLQFKLSFSKLTFPFYTYTAVHMPTTYDDLCDLKTKHDAANGHQSTSSDFFPAYRARSDEKPISASEGPALIDGGVSSQEHTVEDARS